MFKTSIILLHSASMSPFLFARNIGARKTNVAMLTIPNELPKYHDETTGNFELDAFKITHIASSPKMVATSLLGPPLATLRAKPQSKVHGFESMAVYIS
ncbi:uncharacterized protein EV420DRAFT_261300 [Desarmillaria tabescens]|uniref:Uncharacterized protein n=1 Tax=Armillaria tabescens TaxID=1929756 RepID=A0AA39J4L0_ARMTA|nr:uncharacterized protein EV420DRAFT_261300 [Desarmillaria tabescens]KAK0436042.1 hypothetical protein EV420DRAFT_261300 [Desarmillaria tabescens]